MFLVCLTVVLFAAAGPSSSRVFDVGFEFEYGRIEDALAAANAGDTILVHQLPDGAAYEKVAVLVRKPGITIKASANASAPVKISGKGFDYSGVGPVPRAVFQFDPEAAGCILDGFEIFGARNASGNGAGVRINGANNVTVRNCEIHGCDMGVMSGGDLVAPHKRTGINQMYERLNVHHNGSPLADGYSHNFYLGGWNATIRLCEVHHSVSGHNVKSRNAVILIEDSYIHDSANREIDIVDSQEPVYRDNDAHINRCLIIKDSNCAGNRAVIHFGQDMGGKRNGILYIDESAIVTPFIAPVVHLSSAGARTAISKTTLWDGGAGTLGQTIILATDGADLERTLSHKLILSIGFTKGLPVKTAYWTLQDKTRYLKPGGVLELVNPLDESVVFKGYAAEG